MSLFGIKLCVTMLLLHSCSCLPWSHRSVLSPWINWPWLVLRPLLILLYIIIVKKEVNNYLNIAEWTTQNQMKFLFSFDDSWISFPKFHFTLFFSFLDAPSVTFKSVPVYLYSILGYAIYICILMVCLIYC